MIDLVFIFSFLFPSVVKNYYIWYHKGISAVILYWKVDKLFKVNNSFLQMWVFFIICGLNLIYNSIYSN